MSSDIFINTDIYQYTNGLDQIQNMLKLTTIKLKLRYLN